MQLLTPTLAHPHNPLSSGSVRGHSQGQPGSDRPGTLTKHRDWISVRRRQKPNPGGRKAMQGPDFRAMPGHSGVGAVREAESARCSPHSACWKQGHLSSVRKRRLQRGLVPVALPGPPGRPFLHLVTPPPTQQHPSNQETTEGSAGLVHCLWTPNHLPCAWRRPCPGFGTPEGEGQGSHALRWGNEGWAGESRRCTLSG